VDPLDVSQWQFFVVPTSVLDSRMKRQRSITLAGLKHIAGEAVWYTELKEAVGRADAENKSGELL